MAKSRLTTIGNFPTAPEAHAARALLASEGIMTVVVDEILVGNAWYYGNAVGGVKLQIEAADVERARQLLAEEALPADADSEALPTSAWVCSQCRQRVPANFDVCWSCGEPRGPDDAEVPLPEPESAAPQSAAVTKPDVSVRAVLCPGCGATLPTAQGICPQCGLTTSRNPYEAPLHATPAAIKPPSGALRQQRLAADTLAQRAWLAAVFGIVFIPPVLSIYSIVLLIILAERHTRLSPRMFRRVAAAWALNLIALSALILLLLVMLR